MQAIKKSKGNIPLLFSIILKVLIKQRGIEHVLRKHPNH